MCFFILKYPRFHVFFHRLLAETCKREDRRTERKTLNVYGIYKLNTFIKFLLNVSLFANITGNPHGFNENETRMRV